MNKQIKLLSVVITCVENDKKHLKNCLLSLEKSAAFAGVKTEIIIVCNGTSIPNPTYLKSRFKILINKKNIGLAQAINRGMQIAKREWCIILNPDTLTRDDTIINLFQYSAYPKIAIIAPKVVHHNKLERTLSAFPSLWTIFLEQSYLYKSHIAIFRLPNSYTNEYNVTHEVNVVFDTFWLVNKKKWQYLGGFDKNFFLFFQDIDLCRRLKILGYKVLFTPAAYITHLDHQSSDGYIKGDLFVTDLYKFFNKYYPKVYVFLTLLIYFLGCFLRLAFWNIRIRVTQNLGVISAGRKKLIFYQTALFQLTKLSTIVDSSIE